MSWLFGLKSNPANSTYPPESAGGNNSGDDGSQLKETSGTQATRKAASEAYRFDSSALERAAQAAKELEHSSKKMFYGFLRNILKT